MFAKTYFANDKGSTAVEFSLVLPAFLAFIFGIFWVGWVAYSTHSVHFALVEGARALQLKPSITQSQLQTLVRSKTYIGSGTESIAVTLSFDPVSGGAQLAHTTATYPLTFTVPLVGTYTINYVTSMTVPVTAN